MTDGHRIRVTNNSNDDDTEYELICPGGDDCESWRECQRTHLVRDEWELDEQVAHGEYHQIVGNFLCVQMAGCWMPARELEFNEPHHDDGLYAFEYDADFESSSIFIISMELVAAEEEKA